MKFQTEKKSGKIKGNGGDLFTPGQLELKTDDENEVLNLNISVKKIYINL